MRKRASALNEAVGTKSPNIKLPEYVSTGFDALDRVLIGRGGIPTRRYTEIYGKPGACKSLLLYRIISEFQKRYPDKSVAIVDSEFVCDIEWMEQHGVDTSRVDILMTNVFEEASNWLTERATNKYSLLAIDSLGNTQIKKVAEKKIRFGDDADQPGAFEKAVTAFCKHLLPKIHENNIAVIFINQVRSNFGYGASEETPGGNNYKHNLSLRLELAKVEDIVMGSNRKVEGAVVKARLKRSKVGTAGVTTSENHLRFFFESGAEKTKVYDLWDYLVYARGIKQAGPYYSAVDPEGNKIYQWQGKDKAITALMNDEEVFDKLNELREQFKALATDAVMEPSDEDEFEPDIEMD